MSAGRTAIAGVAALGVLVLFAPPAPARPAALVPGTSPSPVWYFANQTTGEHFGNGPTLTWTGTASYVPGIDLQAFGFDGSNGLSGGTTLGNVGTDAFFLDFNLKTTATQQSALISKRPACGASPAFLDVRMHANGTVLAEYYGGNPSNASVTSSKVVNDGKWHTIAIEQVGSQFTLSIDGQAQGGVGLSTIPDITNTADFAIGNGDPCVTGPPGPDGTQPLVGAIDNVYLSDITQGGTVPTDLSATEDTVPTVPPSGSGTLTINLHNPGGTVQHTFAIDPPTGATFTSVTGDGGNCTLEASNRVLCAVSPLASGTTPIDISFTASPSATPGSTLTTTSDGLTNQSANDPNRSNDTFLPYTINIASTVGTPIVNPWAAGGAGFVMALGAGYVLYRRRTARSRLPLAG